jgi:hypothetical protein
MHLSGYPAIDFALQMLDCHSYRAYQHGTPE